MIIAETLLLTNSVNNNNNKGKSHERQKLLFEPNR